MPGPHQISQKQIAGQETNKIGSTNQIANSRSPAPDELPIVKLGQIHTVQGAARACVEQSVGSYADRGKSKTSSSYI